MVMLVVDREEQHLADGELAEQRMRQLMAIEVGVGPAGDRVLQFIIRLRQSREDRRSIAGRLR
jgi:hypothetical protein